MAIADLLRGCPLFRELYDSELESIVRFCTVSLVDRGQSIVRDGDEGDEIFVVLAGQAVVQKHRDNQIITVQHLQRGDVFGEMVLVDQRIRSADIVALTDCEILEIQYSEIFQLFKREPRVFGILVLNMAKLLAQRLRNANQIITTLEMDLSVHPEKLAL